MRRIALALLSVGALLATAALANPTYFVKADMVRADGPVLHGPVCVPNSVFYPGEKIVFRASVIDAASGDELAFEDVQARGLRATVKLDGHEDIQMFFAPAGGADMPPGPSFFRGPWPIPADAAAGAYAWHVEVVDAQGNSATFEPIGQAFGGNSVTIQKAE
ncbi:MAG TPA: hypothetical protein VKB31_02055 [Trueperaceae bacterium]|nr:hypothetical protein [Trueperaceae bacterium]